MGLYLLISRVLMPLSLPTKSVIGLSTTSLLISQVIPALSPSTAIDAAGRLTLDAALVLAVIALWRAVGAKDQKIAEKDAQMIIMAGKTAETMALTMESVKELRVAVTELKSAVNRDDHFRARRT